ncbi:MAG: hypothetical protein KDK08_05620 [Rhizobiaceae bacterium]|nr:hypothetical protein [Rhizobiaceae bacterium]
MDNQQRQKSPVRVNAMVASNKRHAEAMIRWLALDAKEWTPVTYGDSMAGKTFAKAMCLRPVSGDVQLEASWLAEQLRPAVIGDIVAFAQWSGGIATKR